ncbi:hypothetical protein [Oleiagrimonas sp. C23AA]|uniref:hypothetical protein n=1 Tax=Oleiagrimonas sp. C23AA TaxID=2719047 RepID=UPI001424A67E|nr:hypothetical protein [Oleiagrimonas sp. C23AA]NII11659.1 hypothetical protein [Oleiagrimonas sp. C23AA]
MKHLATLAFLLLAAGFYLAGLIQGAWVFFALGMGAETLFWGRLLRRKPQASGRTS